MWEEKRPTREWEGTEEKESSQPWVYVRTEIKEQLQDAENIRKQAVRANLAVNATGILGTCFSLQRDMKIGSFVLLIFARPKGPGSPS